MKYSLLLVALLFSCDVPQTERTQFSDEKRVMTDDQIIGYQIIVIDNCEYLYTGRGRLTHKGNCRFCKERKCK
jgi:hypothetical protein